MGSSQSLSALVESDGEGSLAGVSATLLEEMGGSALGALVSEVAGYDGKPPEGVSYESPDIPVLEAEVLIIGSGRDTPGLVDERPPGAVSTAPTLSPYAWPRPWRASQSPPEMSKEREGLDVAAPRAGRMS